ncbi:MAG: patatin-like phospholipase family protein [Acetobacteraceae bacterium]|nr:patatin-like phospholipase family protein [Acetobacteraceae bacterium]
MGKTVLVLGGGAPNFTLMAGGLLALDEAGANFQLISMAGAGSVIGLIYLAPKGLRRQEALLNTMNCGVSDAIYSWFPVNYKLFNKSGYFADRFREWEKASPWIGPWLHQYGMNNAQKFYSDWLQFQAAITCPTSLDYYSKGICAHAPFIEDLVDFSRMRETEPDVRLNAYCIEEKRVIEFRKHEIDIHHFRAALSFPFIYPPYRIGGKHYYEGAAHQTLNLLPEDDEDASEDWEEVDSVVVFDVLSPELVHRPRDLWDAYAQSIIVPLISIAQTELRLFRRHITHKNQRREHQGKPKISLYQLKVRVPTRFRPHMLTWSKSNLEHMFEFGYKAGRALVEEEERRGNLGPLRTKLAA